jgi:hypothetical protein
VDPFSSSVPDTTPALPTVRATATPGPVRLPTLAEIRGAPVLPLSPSRRLAERQSCPRCLAAAISTAVRDRLAGRLLAPQALRAREHAAHEPVARRIIDATATTIIALTSYSLAACLRRKAA